jgi:hypothetical protein
MGYSLGPVSIVGLNIVGSSSQSQPSLGLRFSDLKTKHLKPTTVHETRHQQTIAKDSPLKINLIPEWRDHTASHTDLAQAALLLPVHSNCLNLPGRREPHVQLSIATRQTPASW